MESEMKRVEKPWGYEIHWAKTDRYVGKVIHVNAGHALSLQYHNIKDETILLYSGRQRAFGTCFEARTAAPELFSGVSARTSPRLATMTVTALKTSRFSGPRRAFGISCDLPTPQLCMAIGA